MNNNNLRIVWPESWVNKGSLGKGNRGVKYIEGVPLGIWCHPYPRYSDSTQSYGFTYGTIYGHSETYGTIYGHLLQGP